MTVGRAAMTFGPRIELHTHLDCSLRIATIEELGAQLDLTYAQPIADLARVAPDCASLVTFLRSIDIELDVLQHVAALERAGRELVEQWKHDAVIHGEVRFAPQLHQRRGLGLDDVVDAVHRGLVAGVGSAEMSTSLIVCVLRHQPPVAGLPVAELAARRSDIVAGLDLSGNEADFPAAEHAQAFAIARAAGVPITIHAGEAAGPDSVRAALALGATRIGHGVRSISDAALVRQLAAEAVTLEVAPICNVVTAAVDSLADHPIRALLDAGVPVTINTDARTSVSTTLDREFDALATQFGWGAAEHLVCQQNAARAAFVSPERRAQLLDLVGGR
jgi:adenosine deaminase